MRVLVTGASGFIGAALCRALVARGDGVVAVTRNAGRARNTLPEGVDVVECDLTASVLPPDALRNVDGIVNLIGESVMGRWTDAKRRAIVESRVNGTANLRDAIAGLEADRRPGVVVSASAIGIYGNRGDEPLTEKSRGGDDFLADVCHRWEFEADAIREFGPRVATLRIGIVLGRDGGAMKPMVMATRAGLGAVVGDGAQWWSWIHIDDLVGLMLYVLDHDVDGTYNATSPFPMRQRDFARALGDATNRPVLARVPAFALRLGAGEMSDELLSSKRVLPHRAVHEGFRYTYPELKGALVNLT